MPSLELIRLNPSIVVFSIGLLFLLNPRTWIIFVILCLVSVALSLSHKIGNVLDRFVVSFITLIAILTALGATGWIFRFNVSATLFIILLAVSTTFVIIFCQTRQSSSTRINQSVTDFLPLICASLVLLLLIIPLVQKFETNYIYQFLGYSSDNLSHIELVNVVNDNGGYVYEDQNALSKRMTAGLVSYPQGYHLSLSVFRDIVSKSVPQFTELRGQLFFYVFVTALFYALFAYMFVRLSQIAVGKSKLGTLLIATSFSILFFGPLLAFYLQGFHTHLFALTLVLTQIFLFCVFGTTKKSITSRYTSYAIILLLAVAISYTWLFILPVSLLACAVVMLPDIYQDVKNRRLSLLVFFLWALMYALLITLALVQVYVQLKFSIKSDPLNEPGNIAPTRQQYVILIGITSFIFYKLVKNKLQKHFAKVLLIFTAISGAFALSIFVFQAHSTGNLSYYFYKAVYGVVVLGTISTAGLIYIIMRRSGLAHKLYQKVLIGSVCALLVSAGLDSQFFAIKNGEVLGLQPPIANELGEILNNVDGDENNYVFVGSCNRNEDYLANRMLSSVVGDHNSSRQAVSLTHINKGTSKIDIINEIDRLTQYTDKQITVIDMSGGGYKDTLSIDMHRKILYKTDGGWKIDNRSRTCINSIK